MDTEFQVLIYLAASLGFFHTIVGPDHYLPFIMIGKAENWSFKRTLWLTFICGIGHILSSVIIGFIGIGIGTQLENLVNLEGFRGNLAAWGLIAFGLVYAVWGLRQWYRHKDHSHNHIANGDKTKITPWVLFVIFVLGPCEVLIPVLMYPAANESLGALFAVTGIFGLSTLLTMMGAVAFVYYGLGFVSFKPFERSRHLIAGTVIFLSGLAIQLLGV